jgi:hypothetical protein
VARAAVAHRLPARPTKNQRDRAALLTRSFEDPVMAVARFSPSIPDNIRFVGLGISGLKAARVTDQNNRALQHEAEVAKISVEE